MPVDPNNIKEKCGKCQTPLSREAVEGDKAASLCMVYEIDYERLKQRLEDEDILPAIIEAIMPSKE